MNGGAALRRFYREASIVPAEGGHALHLDGRLARTPARTPLQVASVGVMALVAAEWNAQSELLEPPSMPVTRLVNVAIDGVAPNPEAVAAEIVRYAGSDLVCYRAAGPDALVELQGRLWDPVLGWARDHLGARFRLGEGVVPVTQPPEAVARIAAAVEAYRDPVALAALHLATTLSGSALIALMLASGGLDADGAWNAAHADETHQERLWGADAEALARRALRRRDFDAAAQVLGLIGQVGD